jgi:hypothetical protein
VTEKPEFHDDAEVRTDELADQDLDQVTGGLMHGGPSVLDPGIVQTDGPGRMHAL